MIGAAFHERYLLACFPSGGVVADLSTGNYFQLNASATAVCDAMSSSATEIEACTRLAEKLSIAPHEAATAIASMARDLNVAAVRGIPQGTYRFFPASGGYALWHGDRPVLLIDGRTFDVSVPPEAPDYSARALALYVRNVAPKILFLRGISVLHASAIEVGNRLVAFAGVSGAGKTTTARAFSDAGFRLFSEDLLVFDPSRSDELSVLKGGEAAVHRWADKAAADLETNRRAARPTADLIAELEGETTSLRSLYFLDVARRVGTQFSARRIRDAEGLTEIMNNNFLASTTPGAWRRFMEMGVALGTATELFAATTPAGTDFLSAAAKGYTSTWRS